MGPGGRVRKEGGAQRVSRWGLRTRSDGPLHLSFLNEDVERGERIALQGSQGAFYDHVDDGDKDMKEFVGSKTEDAVISEKAMLDLVVAPAAPKDSSAHSI